MAIVPGLAVETVEGVLEVWGRAGVLAGEEFAAHRQALLDLAVAVDKARNGKASPFTLTRCASELLHALERYQMPVEEVQADEFTRLLAQLDAGPEVRDPS